LRGIDEKFRTPLVLAEIEGLTYEEISVIEDVPIGTVRSRIARAKTQLKSLLGTNSQEAFDAIPGTIDIGITSHPIAKDHR
jgi:RNA polymerase sigma-70 factor (ECF subfamily)